MKNEQMAAEAQMPETRVAKTAREFRDGMAKVAALESANSEINRRLNGALTSGEQTGPIRAQLCANLIELANTFATLRKSIKQMEDVFRQSARVAKKIT